MTYSEAKERSEALNAVYNSASKALKSIPGINSGPLGLTPESVRSTAEYREATKAYDRAFADLRAFNAVYFKQYKRDIALERRSKGR